MTTDENHGTVPDSMPYLWHLQQIGLLDEHCELTIADAWSSKQVTKVAIVDNGCVAAHPNLTGDRVQRMDFAVDPGGAAFKPPEDQETDGTSGKLRWPPSPHFPGLAGKLLAAGRLHYRLGKGKKDGSPPENIDAFADEFLEDGETKERILALAKDPGRLPRLIEDVPDPSDLFSAHGTSCAGLVAGGPSEEAEVQAHSLNYFGVDPYARVVAANTPYSHEIEPVIMALLYALAQDADVILMPRGVNALLRLGNGISSPEGDPRATRFDTDPKLLADKKSFEKLLELISDMVPVVVAAGNGGGGGLQYPASLVAENAHSLIVVGAHNSLGAVSSYSSGATHSTLFAPSDDGETITRELVRYDEESWRAKNLGIAEHHHPDMRNWYSPFGILCLDIPGPAGREIGKSGSDDVSRNSREKRRRPFDSDSCYAIFGGTSAASSIVAGAVGLLQKAHKLKPGGDAHGMSGHAMKALVEDHLRPVPAGPASPVPTAALAKTIDLKGAWEAASA